MYLEQLIWVDLELAPTEIYDVMWNSRIARFLKSTAYSGILIWLIH